MTTVCGWSMVFQALGDATVVLLALRARWAGVPLGKVITPVVLSIILHGIAVGVEHLR